MFKFISGIVKNDHGSVLEHVNVTFLLQDMSRSLMAQLTRHRHASFCIKSQHYVNHSGFKYKKLEWKQYDRLMYDDLMGQIGRVYDQFVKDGMPHYIAREVLPNAALTNIVMTANIRELRHIIKLRITDNNTPEIIQLSKEMLHLLNKEMPAVLGDLK